MDEWLRYAPPEVLRFQVLKREVSDIFSEALSHWEFDFLQIPAYVEEFDRFEELAFSGNESAWQTYALSLPGSPPARKPKRVSYYQLARIAAWMEGAEDGLRMLKRQGKLESMEGWEVEDVKKRLMLARNWLEVAGYGVLLRNTEEAVKALQSLDARVVEAFAEAANALLNGADPGEAVSKSAEARGLAGREGRLQVYKAFYLALLGEESGPPLRRLAAKQEVREALQRILGCLRLR